MTRSWLCGLAIMLASGIPAAAADVAPLIARIKAVGKEGKGNLDASKAWRELIKEGPAALPDILAGLGAPI